MVAVTTHQNGARRTSRGGRHLGLVAPLASPGAACYRRRRITAAIVVAGAVIVAWAALGAPGGALTASGRSLLSAIARPAAGQGPPLLGGGRGWGPGRGGEAAKNLVVQVAPGDSLWTIAKRLQPSGKVRPLVDRLA
ncbi:MAG: hypothetical protein ACR2HY_09630, partial [Acidimicrobiales bacterium]